MEPEKNALIDKLKALSQQRQLLLQVADYLQNLPTRSLKEMVEDYHKLVGLDGMPGQKISPESIIKKMTQAEWQRIQAQLVQIDRLQAKITAMESSKFWKMRKVWVRLKQMMGLSREI